MSNKIKKYPSIETIANVNYEKPIFTNDTEVYIQEKIDGSNMTIAIDENGEIKIYTRNKQILKNDIADYKNWTEIFTITDKLYNNKNLIDKLKGLNLHGEFIKSGTIPYTKTHKNKFYIFDISKQDVNINIDMDKDTNGGGRGFTNIPYDEFNKYTQILSNEIPVVPLIYKGRLGDILDVDKLLDFVNGRKSLLDNGVSGAEGCVIKTLDGKHRIKVVSTAYREGGLDMVKDNDGKLTFNIQFIEKNRAVKWLQNLIELGLIENDFKLDGKTKSILFKNIKLLVDDFIGEEFDNIYKSILNKEIKLENNYEIKSYDDFKKDFVKILNKQASILLTNYIQNGKW